GTNKLAGAAQRRTREGCLHQGSILPPQHLDLHTLTGALILHLTPLLAHQTALSDLTPQESAKAEELARIRYATDAWNRSR
ncbi:MAG: hypothetical protein SNJ84_07915, partial [Verrucomicrobiia bacterium]